MQTIRRLLQKTKSSSAQGPDAISWRLLKLTKDTKLGREVLADIRQMAKVENGYYGEEEWGQMERG